MKILVARIPEEGSHLKGGEPSLNLELEEGSFIRNAGAVEYELYAQHVCEELVVRGELQAHLDLRCARCSEFFSTTVTVSDFLRAYPAPESVDSVDITEDVREEIWLHVPAFPVCNETCKGVCAQCGTDLNKAPCRCKTEEKPSPWSALDDLSL